MFSRDDEDHEQKGAEPRDAQERDGEWHIVTVFTVWVVHDRDRHLDAVVVDEEEVAQIDCRVEPRGVERYPGGGNAGGVVAACVDIGGSERRGPAHDEADRSAGLKDGTKRGGAGRADDRADADRRLKACWEVESRQAECGDVLRNCRRKASHIGRQPVLDVDRQRGEVCVEIQEVNVLGEERNADPRREADQQAEIDVYLDIEATVVEQDGQDAGLLTHAKPSVLVEDRRIRAALEANHTIGKARQLTRTRIQRDVAGGPEVDGQRNGDG